MGANAVYAQEARVWAIGRVVGMDKPQRKRRFSLAMLIAITAITITGGYYVFWNTYIKKPSRIIEIDSLKLGMRPEEVIYYLGKPAAVELRKPIDLKDLGSEGVIKQTEIPKDRRLESYNVWFYPVGNGMFAFDNAHPNLGLVFGKETGTLIAIGCVSFNMNRSCPDINRITDGSGEEEVLKQFGNPSESRIDNYSYVKTIVYDNLGVEFMLIKRRVYSVRIYQSGHNKDGYE